MRALGGTKQQRASQMQVAVERLPVEPSVSAPQTPRRSFRSGLYAVRPLKKRTLAAVDAITEQAQVRQNLSAFPQPVATKRIVPRYTLPVLTTEEFIQVRLATVRESTRHCFWPTHVIASFLSAEVITDPK